MINENIGGTDASTIMNANRFQNILELWQIKTGRRPKTEGYIEDLLEEFQNKLKELKRLKLMEKPSVPLSEIRKHNPYVQYIGDQYSHRIEYHGIEFVQTFEKTEKGYIYESRRPFEIVQVEFYND